jgi:pre-mRNA-processing factor 19
VASFDEHEGSVGCLSFSENGYYLATGDSREVKLWDLRKLKTFKSIAAPAAVADVTFDHSGLFLAVAAGDEASVHETKTWAQLTRLAAPATGVAFGHKAKQLAVATAEGKVELYGAA